MNSGQQDAVSFESVSVTDLPGSIFSLFSEILHAPLFGPPSFHTLSCKVCGIVTLFELPHTGCNTLPFRHQKTKIAQFRDFIVLGTAGKPSETRAQCVAVPGSRSPGSYATECFVIEDKWMQETFVRGDAETFSRHGLV